MGTRSLHLDFVTHSIYPLLVDRFLTGYLQQLHPQLIAQIREISLCTVSFSASLRLGQLSEAQRISMVLRISNDYFRKQHKPSSFCNWNAVCFL